MRQFLFLAALVAALIPATAAQAAFPGANGRIAFGCRRSRPTGRRSRSSASRTKSSVRFVERLEQALDRALDRLVGAVEAYVGPVGLLVGGVDAREAGQLAGPRAPVE